MRSAGSQYHHASASGVTARAVVVALAVILATAPLSFLGEVVWSVYGQEGGTWGTGAPAPWSVTVLVLLAGLMGLPRLRRSALTREELLVIYVAVLVGTPLTSRHILFYVIPKAITYYHTARQNPLWESVFIQYVPPWFAPNSPGAVEGFFSGGVPVPWREWYTPMAVWYGVMFALFAASLGLIVLISRQWIVNERLSFPLAQIPLETVVAGDGPNSHVGGTLVRNRVFWVAALAAGSVSVFSRLSQLVPALPAIPVVPTKVAEWVGVGPLAGLGALYVNFSPTMLGVVYIIPTELSLSCWVFWLLRLLAHVVSIAMGATPYPPEGWGSDVFPAPYQTGAGALIALGLWVLWIGRRHLAMTVRLAFGRRSDGVSEDDDPLLYRVALAGCAVSFGMLLVFCRLAGCRVVFGLALMSVIIGSFLVWSRIQAETALEPIVAESYGWLLAPINSRILRPQEVITLVTMRWATFPVPSWIFSAPVMNALLGLKVGHSAGIRPRAMAGTIAAAFAVALAVGMIVVLVGIYHYGYFGTDAGDSPNWPSVEVVSKLR